jgi:hypothetical protein
MEARFYDAHYLDVQADPIAALRGCYDKFGIAFTATREAKIRAWMEEDRATHAKGPKHSYALPDFGLDLAAIDRVYADYYADSKVAKER